MAAKKKTPKKKLKKTPAKKTPAKKKPAKKKAAKKKPAKKKPKKKTFEQELTAARPGPLGTLVENQAILFDEVGDVRVRLEQLEDVILLEINDLAKKIQDFTISFWDEMNAVRGALGVPAETGTETDAGSLED